MTFEHIWASADGSHVAAAMTMFTGDLAGVHKSSKVLSLVDPKDAKEIKRLVEGDQPTHVAFSPDNKAVAAILGGEIKLWDAASFEPIPLLARGKHLKLAFSHEGKSLYSLQSDGAVAVYDPSQGQETSRFNAKEGHSRTPRDVAFANRKPVIVSVGENGEILLFRHRSSCCVFQ